jgi:hypothetical protein
MDGVTLHPANIAVVALVACGPIPLAAAATKKIGAQTEGSASLSTLAALSAWLFVNMTIAMSLGALAAYTAAGVAAAEALVGIAGIAVLRRTPPRQAIRPRRWLRPLVCLFIAWLGFIALCLAWTVLTRPISGYDCLSYHLHHIALWYQSGRFEMMESFADTIARYAFGWEALCGLFVVALGDDGLVALPQLVVWAVYGLGIYCLARQVGAVVMPALSVAAVAMCYPFVLLHVNSASADVPLAAAFVSALTFAMVAADRGGRARPAADAAFVTATAMVAATKTSGLLYAAILLVSRWLLGRSGAGHSGGRDRRHWSQVAIVAAAGFVACFWYGRNWVETGNPLGLVGVALGGWTVFAGPVMPQDLRATSLFGVFDWADPQDVTTYSRAIHKSLGPGVVWLAATGLLGLVISTVGTPRARPAATRLAAAVLCVTFLLYWLTPYSATNSQSGITPWVVNQVRFAAPFLALLAALSAIAITVLRVPNWIAAAVALALCATAIDARGLTLAALDNLDAVPVHHASAALLLLVAIGVAARRCWRRSGPRGQRTLRLVFASGAVLAAGAAWRATRQYRHDVRPSVLGPVVAFLRREVPVGDAIGYISSHRAYLLFGDQFGRRVAFLSWQGESAEAWLTRILSRGIRWLAVGPATDDAASAVQDLLEGAAGVERRFGVSARTEMVIYYLGT